MNHDEIDAVVRDVFSVVFHRAIDRSEDVSRETEATWDSLKHVELIFMLEERLGVRFPDALLPELGNISKIIRIAVEMR